MWPTVTDRLACRSVRLSVRLSVCLSVTVVSPAKNFEPIEMSFGMLSRLTNRALDEDALQREGELLGECLAH